MFRFQLQQTTGVHRHHSATSPDQREVESFDPDIQDCPLLLW